MSKVSYVVKAAVWILKAVRVWKGIKEVVHNEDIKLPDPNSTCDKGA